MTPGRWLGLVLAAVAVGGCGLKGPLFLPEKSEVTIRPAPAPSAPETPGEAPASGEPAPDAQPAPQPGPTVQDPPGGPGRV